MELTTNQGHNNNNTAALEPPPSTSDQRHPPHHLVLVSGSSWPGCLAQPNVTRRTHLRGRCGAGVVGGQLPTNTGGLLGPANNVSPCPRRRPRKEINWSHIRRANQGEDMLSSTTDSICEPPPKEARNKAQGSPQWSARVNLANNRPAPRVHGDSGTPWSASAQADASDPETTIPQPRGDIAFHSLASLLCGAVKNCLLGQTGPSLDYCHRYPLALRQCPSCLANGNQGLPNSRRIVLLCDARGNPYAPHASPCLHAPHGAPIWSCLEFVPSCASRLGKRP